MLNNFVREKKMLSIISSNILKKNREFLKVEVNQGEVVVDMEAKNINNLK